MLELNDWRDRLGVICLALMVVLILLIMILSGMEQKNNECMLFTNWKPETSFEFRKNYCEKQDPSPFPLSKWF